MITKSNCSGFVILKFEHSFFEKFNLVSKTSIISLTDFCEFLMLQFGSRNSSGCFLFRRLTLFFLHVCAHSKAEKVNFLNDLFLSLMLVARVTSFLILSLAKVLRSFA